MSLPGASASISTRRRTTSSTPNGRTARSTSLRRASSTSTSIANSNYSGSTDPTVIDSFVRRFDLANVNQNLVKIVLDANPAPFWDIGFEAIYKKNDYKDTLLGRKDDQRQEFYGSVAWGDARSFRVMLFGDIEFMEYNSLHRVGAGNANPLGAACTGSARRLDHLHLVGQEQGQELADRPGRRLGTPRSAGS
jgi:hypothetical protein